MSNVVSNVDASNTMRYVDMEMMVEELLTAFPSGEKPSVVFQRIHDIMIESGWLVRLDNGHLMPKRVNHRTTKQRFFTKRDGMVMWGLITPEDPNNPGWSEWFLPWDYYEKPKDGGVSKAREFAVGHGIGGAATIRFNGYPALKDMSAHCGKDDPERRPLAESAEFIPGVRKSTRWRVRKDFDYTAFDRNAEYVNPKRNYF